MGPVTALSIYLVFWWVTLFTVLPLGVKTYHEAGVDPGPGCEPGAPMNPNLKRKFFTTTWLSAVFFAIFYVVVRFQLITLPPIAQTY